jgi:hypothetical protein
MSGCLYIVWVLGICRQGYSKIFVIKAEHFKKVYLALNLIVKLWLDRQTG